MAGSTRARKPATPRQVFDHLAPAWFDAVCTRKSIRAFETERVKADDLQALIDVCTIYRPFDDARVEFISEAPDDLFKGIIGSYGKVTGAPHALAVIVDRHPSAMTHAGYIGEAAVLEATRLGLGTCWVGGFFREHVARGTVEIQPDEQIVAVSPIGYARDGAPEGPFHGHERRKPVDVIAPGISDDWPAWARAAVECARLAPSAVNRQPWRFRVCAGRLNVTTTTRPSISTIDKALDCGIAMLHAELGAFAADVSGTWTDTPDDGHDLAYFEPAEKPARRQRRTSQKAGQQAGESVAEPAED